MHNRRGGSRTALTEKIMSALLIAGIIVSCGFLFGELAVKVRLPKVTGYILAGVLLNPSLFSFVPKAFVDKTDPITNIALCFITFGIGGSLLYSRIKKLGKPIVMITLFEAEFAFLMVSAGLALALPYFLPSNSPWIALSLPLGILLGSLASPTDPSADLAVAHQYRAKGPVTSAIMGVAAFDDALGIMNYSFAVVLASVLVTHQEFSFSASVIAPLIVIAGAIGLGAVFGLAFNLATRVFKKETDAAFIVVITALLTLCFGTASFLKIDQLLSTMAMGIVVVNFNPKRDRIFKVLERYTEELIFVVFFTLSGMHLDFSVLAKCVWLVVIFAFFRILGKVLGTALGGALSGAPPKVKKYTTAGLLPQGGIIIGLALLLRQKPEFSSVCDVIISIVIGSTVIHELIAPPIVKLALKKAGEIR